MHYRSAYRQPMILSPAPPKLVPRVVFVMIDGLTRENAEQMAWWQRLRGSGAFASSRIALPSISQPSWSTLVTGATPEINGAALTNAPFDAIRPIRVDQIFAVARRGKLRTALAGNKWWQHMVVPEKDWDHPSREITYPAFNEDFDAAGDRAAAASADAFLHAKPDFSLVYFGECDEVGHDFGANGPQYAAALRRTDGLVCDVLSHIDLLDTVVIITSDHGHIPGGGHGGDESAVRFSPLVIAGPRIKHGVYGIIPEEDVAMTLCALLGLPPPRSGEGTIQYNLLLVSDREKALGLTSVAGERLRQVDAYLEAISRRRQPGILEKYNKLEAYNKNLLLLSANGQFHKSAYVATGLIDAISQLKQQQQRVMSEESQRARLSIAAVAVTIMIIIVIPFMPTLAKRAWKEGNGLVLLLAAVGLLTWECCYHAMGYGYSISYVINVGLLPKFAAVLVASSMIMLAVLCILVHFTPQLKWDKTRIKWDKALNYGLTRNYGPDPANSVMEWPLLLKVVLAISVVWILSAIVVWVTSGNYGSWRFFNARSSFALLLLLLRTITLSLIMASAIAVRTICRWMRRN